MRCGGCASGIDYGDEHEAFAASRSTDYIYEAGSDCLYSLLDTHAETIDCDVKLPLVITGSAGCGKSALLANWVKRRRSTKHRDEFLFQHFVGSSLRSKQLCHLLFRLETALKEHFQLREMEVPTSEERLRWSLNRFLAAAAKKQFPARIVIVMDAVNRLCGESSAADTLHWLPTDLPQGVRIIVSTLELESSGQLIDDYYDEGSRVHRTCTELRRRKCPTIRLQPLSVEVRHLIIGSFVRCNQQALHSLEQAQQFRLVTAKASSQPLFLRTVLYAIRLGFEMSKSSIDSQIDVYLAADNAVDLISRVLDMCNEYVMRTVCHSLMSMHAFTTKTSAARNKRREVKGVAAQNVLAHVLTAVYASRHGLSEAEMWGIVELATGQHLPLEQRECIRRVLRDFTFSVNKLKNFSHEDYAAVVYNKYIRLPDVHIRSHQLMARYFGKLPPCDRKLDALPYHLEVAGSWSRLRTALVDVRMFRLWWTPTHKTVFLNLWASLTTHADTNHLTRRLVTGEFSETMRCKQSPRPCLDIVDEYVRSVDDYKSSYRPCDDLMAVVILRIADFMLEFATLSLEEAADVPQFAHPAIPTADLASLGVPYLSRDKDGNSILNTPFVDPFIEASGKGSKVIDIPLKVNEDIPVCSTYFYHRWMWVQFPYVALANCGDRFLQGVLQQRNRQDHGVNSYSHSRVGSTLIPPVSLDGARDFLSVPRDCRNNTSHGSFRSVQHDRAKESAPQIQTSRRDNSGTVVFPRSTSRIALTKPSWNYLTLGVLSHAIPELQRCIEFARTELNHLFQDRVLRKKLCCRLSQNYFDMCHENVSAQAIDKHQNHLLCQIELVSRNQMMAKLLSKNYESVKLMCRRHPAHNQALIDELEAKHTQDSQFLADVRQQLTYISFFAHTNAVQVRHLQRAARSISALQNEMVVQRVRQKKNLHLYLPTSVSNDTMHGAHTLTAPSTPSAQCPVIDGSSCHLRDRKQNNLQFESDNLGTDVCNANALDDLESSCVELLSTRWDDHAEFIRKRTFLTDPKEFFSKFYNAQTLQSQMTALHEAAESRLKDLKVLLNSVESELEQVRYDSQSLVGSNSREARELQTRLTAQLARHKHSRESSLAVERLRQAAFGGVKHVCSTLGIPPPDLDTPVNEIIHQVESVLEALIEEKDKSAQKIGDSHQATYREATHGYEKLVRAPELDAALEQFEMPKALVANRLPAKSPLDELRIMNEGEDADDIGCDEGVRCRADVKREALKNLRVKQRRLARLAPPH